MTKKAKPAQWQVRWVATKIHEGGKEGIAVLRVKAPGRAGKLVEMPPSSLTRPRQAADKVIDHCGVAHSVHQLEQAIKAAAAAGSRREFRVVSRSGYVNDKVFVTPARVLSRSDKDARIEFDAEVVRHNPAVEAVGQRKGTLAGWRSRVAEHAGYSSACIVVIGAAFAAALLRYADLSEAFLLMLTGTSSSGKTLTTLLGMSVQGSAGRSQTVAWTTERSLEEIGAAFNDLLTPFDDLSRVPPNLAREVARFLTHQFADGGGRLVAHAQMQQGLAFRRFRSIGILSGERDSQTMAAMSRQQQLPGEAARMFDVRTSGKNGVFDRLRPRHELTSATLARRLEKGVAEHYGVALPAFLEWLFRKSEKYKKRRVKRLIKTFCKALPTDATTLERRAASKFGLIYAALVLANEAKIVPWTPKRSRNALLKVFREGWQPPQMEATGAELVARLKAQLATPGAILKAEEGSISEQEFSRPWILLRSQYQGKPRYGLRVAALNGAFTADERQRLVQELVALGWAQALGGRQRWQPRVLVDNIERKPRLLPIDAGPLLPSDKT